MLAYPWPGNIRELENLMERSVLLAEGRTISAVNLPVGARAAIPSNEGQTIKTMTESEREHILAALHHCKWKVSGKTGAADLLGMNASTLYSRMKKLGIEKKISNG